MHNLDWVLPKLKESIDVLETAISNAKQTLKMNSNCTNSHLLRLDSYFSIVNKQRGLVKDLEHYYSVVTPSNSDIVEMGRKVELINALSAMIKDDAHDLMNSILRVKSTNEPSD
jgi:hypothetical protein